MSDTMQAKMVNDSLEAVMQSRYLHHAFCMERALGGAFEGAR